MNLGVICVASKLYKREKHCFFLVGRGGGRAKGRMHGAVL